MTAATPLPGAPSLLALDWGTSSLRAFLIGADGQTLATRASAHGIQALPEPGAAGFEAALDAIAGDWLAAQPRLAIVACGMVGSAQGWLEAPYVRCPAAVATLAGQAARVETALGRRIAIAPGLLFDPADERPDVMRGEEIQIAGALEQHPALATRATIVLPGTHSKWAEIDNGRVIGFATAMTGELFAVLSAHSILGRLMQGEAEDAAREAAFGAGLDDARRTGPGDLVHQLFATRTLGLTGRVAGGALADYLSGLLIGHEIVSGLRRAEAGTPLVLVGAPALCGRYQRALAAFGRPATLVLDNTAPAGLFAFARALGLLA